MAGKADVCQGCPGRALCLRQGVWALAGSSLQQLPSSDSLPSWTKKPAAVSTCCSLPSRSWYSYCYHYLLKNKPTLKTNLFPSNLLQSSEVHTPTSYVEQKRIREVASVVKDVGLEYIKASTICIISATRYYWANIAIECMHGVWGIFEWPHSQAPPSFPSLAVQKNVRGELGNEAAQHCLSWN